MNIQGLPAMAHGLATAASGSTGSSSSTPSGPTLNANSAAQTFIQLLVTELQSQDPTSPMDPTAMVGQMFSMNQLQQLIDINQTLSAAMGGVAGSSGGSSATSASSNVIPSNIPSSQLQTTALPTSAAALYAQHLMKGAN